MDMEYDQHLETFCKGNDILLIVDEVQTGIGRTGTFLCCEQYQIHPHIITLAKGLGGRLPIGAVLMDEQTENVFQPGHHGSTFGGIPVVCAGGIEVLKQVYSEAFLSSVSAKAVHLKECLLTLPGVTDVSGLRNSCGGPGCTTDCQPVCGKRFADFDCRDQTENHANGENRQGY